MKLRSQISWVPTFNTNSSQFNPSERKTYPIKLLFYGISTNFFITQKNLKKLNFPTNLMIHAYGNRLPHRKKTGICHESYTVQIAY